MIDDFWGSWEWANFEREIRRVLPEFQIREMPLDHPIFNAVYRIDEILQVPGDRQPLVRAGPGSGTVIRRTPGVSSITTAG